MARRMWLEENLEGKMMLCASCEWGLGIGEALMERIAVCSNACVMKDRLNKHDAMYVRVCTCVRVFVCLVVCVIGCQQMI